MSSARPLRIGIDAHAIGNRKTGNERFISNIIREMQTQCDHQLIVYVTSPSAFSEIPKDARTQVKRIRPSTAVPRITWGLPRAARRDRLDVLLVQYSSSKRVPCPVVNVVHDVSFAAHPEFFAFWPRLWMPRTIPRSLKHASRVVTVSEFSSQEIQSYYHVPEHKISVVPDAPDPRLMPGKDLRSLIDPPFFLALGNIEKRKNLTTLVKAFRRARSEHPEMRERLVIAGADGFGSEEVHEAAHGAGDDIRFTGYLSDTQVAGLLQRATALAYPSRYEGFGLPVIEAMAAGIPVLVSDIPVMDEVAGGAAAKPGSQDEAAWADALANIALDPALRARMVEKGLEQAGHFSWTQSAGEMIAALESAALAG